MDLLVSTEWLAKELGASDLRIAMTAFAHFALCSPLIEHYDFDTALMFKEDPVSGGIIYKDGGVVEVPDTPGLGATVSDDKLAMMEKVII